MYTARGSDELSQCRCHAELNVAITLTHTHSTSLDNIKRTQVYGFRGLNIMDDRNYINYSRDSSNGMESRFKP